MPWLLRPLMKDHRPCLLFIRKFMDRLLILIFANKTTFPFSKIIIYKRKFLLPWQVKLLILREEIRELLEIVMHLLIFYFFFNIGLRNTHNICPPEVLKFLLDLFKYNDNTKNNFSDNYYRLVCVIFLRFKTYYPESI